MSFTKSTTDIKVHQKLGDYPNVDDELSADELKRRFDSPAEQLQNDLNKLIEELESETSANSLGASKLDEDDISSSNVYEKLKKIYEEFKTHRDKLISTDVIAESAITTGKINDSAIKTSKIDNSAITTEKITDGAVTLDKLDANAKKASNLFAEKINDNDESENNIQAKLKKIYDDLIGVSQGSVADNSITQSKLSENSVTTEKIQDNSITTNKIADKSITSQKIVNGFGLVPTGLICMWSGSQVPDGWYLCDGKNNTPDLRDRFVVGSGSSYSIGDKGGENSVTLTIDQLPKHSHTYTRARSDRGYEHNSLAYGTEAMRYNDVGVNTGDAGKGEAHENRPPYYALAYIMKG